MKLWCYTNDRCGWGNTLYYKAYIRGIPVAKFTDFNADMRKGDYAFMRIPQWEPWCSEAKKIATTLHELGLRLIPDFHTIMSYEDKVMQARSYRRWMPYTKIYIKGMDSWQDALRDISVLGYPFISKSREGSASKNVRLINNVQEANAEWMTVMHGDGLFVEAGGSVNRQKDYLLWQELCKNNGGDLRACINGRHVLLLKRHNKPGTLFASGSGLNSPVVDASKSEREALLVARQFFEENNLKWCGIDLVKHHDTGEWKILETTLAWSLPAYDNCPYFGTRFHGRDMWNVLLDEIQKGVFE